MKTYLQTQGAGREDPKGSKPQEENGRVGSQKDRQQALRPPWLNQEIFSGLKLKSSTNVRTR